MRNGKKEEGKQERKIFLQDFNFVYKMQQTIELSKTK